MKNTLAFTLILALGAPASAELAAPGLPFIDAAVVRSQPFEKENINLGAAFPGMQVCNFKAVEGKNCLFACKDGSIVSRPAIVSSLVPNGCAKFVMVPAAAAQQAAPELPLIDAAAVRAGLPEDGRPSPSPAWEDYDTPVFPNGSVIWNLRECAAAYKDARYLGCYASPEISVTRREQGKKPVRLRGMIVSKIQRNENDHDSGGYGYCLKDRHPYRITHEVRVMEKGKPVAYLYPEFYAGAFAPGAAQNLYEWGGSLWGTSNCDKTDKSLVFSGGNAYTVTSPAAALDFGNIVFTLDEKQLTFTKL